MVSEFRRRQVHTGSNSGNDRLDSHDQTRRRCIQVLVYAAVLNANLTYGVLGLLISALIYLLYRFNEWRLQESNAQRPSNVVTWKRWPTFT